MAISNRRSFQWLLGLMACAVFLPNNMAQAQAGRVESDAARSAFPVLPKRPPVTKANTAKTIVPKVNAVAAVTVSDVQTNSRPGFTGVVLGARIQSTLSYLGVNRCSARIKQVMLALADNRPAAYYLEPTAPNPNQAPLLITLESLSGEDQSAGSRYSILTINPDCSGFYTQTVSWPDPCADVARVSFPNFRFDRRVVANVDSFRASPTLQMSTMKTPGGCVTVKKEIFR